MLAFWFHAHMNRMNKINKMRSDAATEKAALIVETARKQATMERQLNEYIAHVRVLSCALFEMDEFAQSVSLTLALFCFCRRFATRFRLPLQP
jgi:hypothetical protein